jgi:colanic acid/amylovoran biosynthesis glycosyltransferase
MKAPRRVIHSCTNWLHQNQTWIYQQVRHLPHDRIEPHIVCWRTENLDQFAVPNLNILGGPNSRQYWREKSLNIFGIGTHSPFLVNNIRRLGAEIVHSHSGDEGWYHLPSVRKTTARHVVTFYGYDVNGLPATHPVWVERYAELFSNVDRILCEGPYMASAIKALGCPLEKIRVHHLGVANDNIEFVPRRWTPGTPLRVLIAASFLEKKGIPDALSALARVKNDAPLEITIVGGAQPLTSSYREERRIHETMAATGLASNVQLLGYMPHEKLLKEAYLQHIFLSPSRIASDGDTEGGAPVAIIEMAATGMPVVSTRHCDIPAVVQHERTGLLAEEGDIDGLVNNLLWLIRNPDDWLPMLEAARLHIENSFNARTQGVRLADLYDELFHVSASNGQ